MGAVGDGHKVKLLNNALFGAKDVAVCSEVADELGADLGSVLAVAQEV